MTGTAYQVYEPLGVLKSIADDVWIVDGPEIRFRYGPLRMPFPTRMTMVRLPDGGLWVHSPVPLNDALIGQLAALGPVAHLVAPNTIHYWWVRDWKERFPEAQVWSVSRLAEGARDRLPSPAFLEDEAPDAWRGVIEQVVVDGSRIMEAVFFHRASRTLILADLIENFEDDRFNSRFYRWLSHFGGVIDPDGKAPWDLQQSFSKNRESVRLAVERMIAWEPVRIVLAHGRWYRENAANELRRAFRWILPG